MFEMPKLVGFGVSKNAAQSHPLTLGLQFWWHAGVDVLNPNMSFKYKNFQYVHTNNSTTKIVCCLVMYSSFHMPTVTLLFSHDYISRNYQFPILAMSSDVACRSFMWLEKCDCTSGQHSHYTYSYFSSVRSSLG